MNSVHRRAGAFVVFRAYLGAYLATIFVTSVPYAADIWSDQGMVRRASSNLSYGLFPNVLNAIDSPSGVRVFLVILAVLALMLAAGRNRRVAALLLWYGWACLLHRNNLTVNPSIHYVGWLLLACTLIPPGENEARGSPGTAWSVPATLVGGGWVLFAGGYFLSGWDKLASPSWVDGSALERILNGPLGQPLAAAGFAHLPAIAAPAATWVAVFAELSCLPLALLPQTRKWALLVATMLQVGILLTVDVAPISFGMLAFHLFLFDAGWVPDDAFRLARPARREGVT